MPKIGGKYFITTTNEKLRIINKNQEQGYSHNSQRISRKRGRKVKSK
jgi:hypothetical protein